MKSNEWKKAGLLMALIGAAAMAQAEQGQGKGKGGKDGGRKMPPHIMEQFDTDGDGQLNEEERETMRVALGAEGRPIGREGQGRKGRRQMSPEMREKILAEFDADGDGELNEDERAAARAAAAERRGERPEGEEGKKDKGKGKGKNGKGNREEMMKKYDTDADGKLSEEEREALKADRKNKQKTEN